MEALQNWAIPSTASKGTFSQLARAYKQISAPFGVLSINALKVSTAALQSADPDDATYHRLSEQMAAWTTRRDGLAAQMKAFLDAAAFDDISIDRPSASLLIDQAKDLQKEAERAVKRLK